MGEPMTPPRTTTLSPTKLGGRSLAFGSPKDNTRSNAFQSTRNNPLSPSGSLFHNSVAHHHQVAAPGGSTTTTTAQSLNSSVSGGPPTQGLFDSLASSGPNDHPAINSPRIDSKLRQMTSPYTPGHQAHPSNEALYTPRRQSIIPGPKHNFTASPFPAMTNPVHSSAHTSSGTDCWVTVFGFPQSATSMILSHFSQCGTIVNKMHPQNSGNWMHLRFTSRLECDRALNYNEKVLNNFFMVGVARCKDQAVLELEQGEDAENSSYAGNHQNTPSKFSVNASGVLNGSSIRPLAHIAYKTVQNPTDVVASPTAPTKSTGILDRAMDFFLGW